MEKLPWEKVFHELRYIFTSIVSVCVALNSSVGRDLHHHLVQLLLFFFNLFFKTILWIRKLVEGPREFSFSVEIINEV